MHTCMHTHVHDYLDVVIKELSLNNTYKEVHSNNVNIISRHLDYMVKNEIDVQEQHEQLPYSTGYLSCTRNLMVPGSLLLPGFAASRFIAASNKCTTKQLSSVLTSCFKTILTHYKQYCDGIYNHSGINCFWIVNNSTEVLDRLHQINKTSRARRFDSYDFTTLYTNIPHNALKNNIRSLVREAFKIRGGQIHNCGQAW